MDIRYKLITVSSLFSMVLLSACGGGGSDAPIVTPPTTPPTTLPPVTSCRASSPLQTVATSTAIRFSIEPSYQVGQSAMIMASLANRNSAGVTFDWQQTSGPTLALASVNSPMLAFDLTDAGSYEFTLTTKLHSTNQPLATAAVQINVDSAQSNRLNARLDHQVVENNAVSLRLGRKNNQAVTNISWCQASGPTVSLNLDDKEKPLFTAPSVSNDELIHLVVSGDFSGESLRDDVYLLTTQESTITSSYFDTPVARTHSYTQSDYSQFLASCVYSNQLTESCNAITRLPLIGQVDPNADRATIMDRVLVSHDWMGENFEAFLTQMDMNSDFAKLLQSVTAIVISYDVRPSFYWVVTGAIYLDPENLWLTPTQRDTINEAADYRSDFGKDLNFLMPWRYVKNNQYASNSIAKTQRQNRTIADLTPNLASLLYHELAHANDFFPRSIHSSIQGPTLQDDFTRRDNAKALISDQLNLNFPLASQPMYELARISFKGETASSLAKSYSSADVASFFSADKANDFYAYSSTREDAAMLFEEAMMSYRLGIRRDVAVTDKPTNASADTITVAFGQRGRIADPSIKSRVSYVLDNIMPELNSQTVLAALPAVQQMAQGQSWAANLNLTSPSQAKISIKNSAGMNAPTINIPNVMPLQLSGEQHGKAQ
ncbi:hypothetical protein [Shewanella sp.]|uniref:hypothetical protein n=1 Tax=Shewanella sp. TaxID=50422 RepID=UPI0040539105